MKKKLYILLVLTLGLCANLKAQKFATDTPIRKQAVENKIPGANYAPTVQTNTAKSKGFEGSSLARQIREGKEEGMKYTTTNSSPKNPTEMSNEKPDISGNNLSVSEKKVKETDATPAKAPSQEGKKE